MNKNISIILADDDEDERLLFSIAKDVIDQEIDLKTFRDGEEFIQYMNLEPELPTMLFLELNMRRMSGLECLKAVRSSILWKDVPVAMYSISGSETEINESQAGGAQVYIMKPNNIIILAEMIHWAMHIDWKNTVLHSKEFFTRESTWKKKE